jgi:hypothetical protein
LAYSNLEVKCNLPDYQLFSSSQAILAQLPSEFKPNPPGGEANDYRYNISLLLLNYFFWGERRLGAQDLLIGVRTRDSGFFAVRFPFDPSH